MTHNKNIIVMGAGPIGIFLSSMISAKGLPVFLWLSVKKEAEKLRELGTIELVQKTITLDKKIEIISGYEHFQKGNWIILNALSSQIVEESLEKMVDHLDPKGEHIATIFSYGLLSRQKRKKYQLDTFTDYLDHLANEKEIKHLTSLSVNGPSLSNELVDGFFSFFNIGSKDKEKALEIKALLENKAINITISPDRRGVELAGVLKNPLAIACGLASGMPNCGHNFIGQLLSLGFKEMLRFGESMEISQETLLGRSGLADLIATGTSHQSRNFAFGKKFISNFYSGKGNQNIVDFFQRKISPAKYIENQVKKDQFLVEGGFALSAILDIAQEKEIELPLYQIIFEILSRQAQPQDLIHIVNETPWSRKKKSARGETKQKGLASMKGQQFRKVLVDRVIHKIVHTPGMQDRIQRQSTALIQGLEKRLEQAKSKNKPRETKALPVEINLLTKLEKASHNEVQEAITEIASYYASEIGDSYLSPLREFFYWAGRIIRLFMSGFRPGGSLPYIGGFVKEAKEAAANYNVFYIPMHRSHTDSIETSFAIRKTGLPMPRFAAGINLMTDFFWTNLLRSLGAYSVDRERTRSILYLECLGSYSSLMLEYGIPTLLYAEGTRSRTGGCLPLKTGLMSTALEAFRQSGREVMIIPIALSYEVVPEDVEFCVENAKIKFSEYLTKRKKVYLEYCPPIPVSRHIQYADPMASIGNEILHSWNKYIKVLPNQIIAKILVENELNVPMSNLKELVNNFILTHDLNYLSKKPGKIMDRGLDVLKKQDLISIEGRILKGKSESLLKYYATMIPE